MECRYTSDCHYQIISTVRQLCTSRSVTTRAFIQMEEVNTCTACTQ